MKITVTRFTIELISPLHIGSGNNNPDTDAAVVRDAFGDYRIPGSSIAGALRAFCGNKLYSVWGTAGKENKSSAIEVSDGFLIDWDGKTTLSKRISGGDKVEFPTFVEIQDHVRIDHECGTAEDGGKFDAEIVPEGTRFRCEMTLIERNDDPLVIEAFQVALNALAHGEIALGGDLASGLGQVRILNNSATQTTFDLSNSSGLSGARNRPAAIDQPSSVNAKPLNLDKLQVSAPENIKDCLCGKVTINFRADGPLLVGGSQKPSSDADADRNHGADLVFSEARVADYQAKKLIAKPWVPGSSLRGAIRHRVWHILEAIAPSQANERINNLFGFVDGNKQSASKIRVHGQFLEQIPRTQVQHVAIDRLTGGSLKGALYSEAPIWRDDLEIKVGLVLDQVTLADAAVLAHAIIDMGNGELQIGGGARRGNGQLLFAQAKAGQPNFLGKSIEFQINLNNVKYSNSSPKDSLEKLIDMLESANATLAGATT